MEFEKVIRTYNRMCKRYRDTNHGLCSETCPLKVNNSCGCLDNMLKDAKSFEQILTDWNKKHPPKTNIDVLKEKTKDMDASALTSYFAHELDLIDTCEVYTAFHKWLNEEAEE